MFSEVLKIIPQLDDKDLKKMTDSLQGRFVKITKSFGKGLLETIKGGGMLGLGLELVNKFLNPLKEVQEALDRTLHTSSDLAVNAKDLNTSSGKLYKLVQLAHASGLDQESLMMLMTKFQTAVANAKANPLDPNYSAVRNFTGQKDTADAFFSFVQALQKMDRNSQLLVEQQTFGERNIGRAGSLFQSLSPDNLAHLMSSTGLDKADSSKLTQSIDHLSAMQTLSNTLDVQRNLKDVVKKASVINDGTIQSRDAAKAREVARENDRLANYQHLAKLAEAADTVTDLMEKGMTKLTAFSERLLPKIERMATAADKWMGSPIARGINKLFGGGSKDGD